MLDRFRNSQPYVFLLIGFISIFLWLPVFINPSLYWIREEKLFLPLSDFLHFSGLKPGLLSGIFGWIGFMGVGYLLTFMNNRFLFLEKRNYLPLLFFIWLGYWIPGIQHISSALVALFFVLFALYGVMQTLDVPEKLSLLFNAGFLIGLASFIYFPYLIFILVLWMGTFIFRTITIRNWLTSIAGILTPWVLLYGFFFFLTGNIFEINNKFTDWFHPKRSIPYLAPEYYFFLAVVLFVFLVSSFYMMRNISFKSIRPKKQFYFFFWTFILLTLVFAWIPGERSRIFIADAVPLSFLFSHYFTYAKSNFFNNLIFYLLLISGLAIQYLPLFLK